MKIRNVVASLALVTASAGAFASTSYLPAVTGAGYTAGSASVVTGTFSDSWTFDVLASGLTVKADFGIADALPTFLLTGATLDILKDGALVSSTTTPGAWLSSALDKGSLYTFVLSGKGAGQYGQGNYSFSLAVDGGTTTPPVPEPETYALMGLGLVALVAARSRRRK